MGEASEAADRSVRVALVGFGRVGTAVLELALMRPWIEVVAVVAHRPERDGEPAADSVAGAPAGMRVRTDVDAAIRDSRPDAVILATTSRLPDVLDQLAAITSAGADVVLTTAEELAHVEPTDGEAAAALHDLIDTTGVRVIATGVNPGFVLDLWPLVLSALAWDIERIEARRIVDVSVFAPHTRAQLGIGHDAAGFEAGVADGSIAGHLGFSESLRLLCAAMGTTADDIAIDTRPVMAERRYELADGAIEAGTTVGATQRAVARRDGSEWIAIELLLHVAPAEDGIRTIDESHIYGRHELHATLEPGAGAILSTAAQLINTIPVALEASPGLYGPGELRPSAPWLAPTAAAWARPPAAAMA